MTSEYTILVDNREKTPLSFPAHLVVPRPGGLATKNNVTTVRLTVRSATLNAGDYALLGFESCALVERKGSIREIFANTLSADRDRFIAALDKLAVACKFPLLLLEGDPFHLMMPTEWQPQPGVPLSHLLELLAFRRISWAICSTNTLTRRRAIGELVARHLISCSCALSSPTLPEKSTAVTEEVAATC